MIENPYNDIAEEYELSHEKPDKKYSTLPTVLLLAGDVHGKVVLDLGCGSGFFTRAFARVGANKVIGIDNSNAELTLARHQPVSNIEYIENDIFSTKLPSADIICAPYVINYVATSEDLLKFFISVYQSLTKGGKFIGVIDLPGGFDNRRFGALKFIEGDMVRIELYNENNLICTLSAHYFSREVVENTLRNAGFGSVEWHEPIISREGIEKFGEDFWKDYTQQSELGYFVAY